LIPQQVSVWKTINLYDKPGFIGTKIISQIVPIRNDGWTFFLEITAATEETETIDGNTDRWLKTNYNGIEGWIFGGYVDVERGGPKYYIPENIILSHLAWY
jgi:hypothetical protein